MAEETPRLAQKKAPIVTFTGFTILFFVLLRISIGWHLAYEGCWKLRQDHWTAAGYLQASTGPLRPLFLELVPDANATERLTRDSILKRMDERAQRAIDHYNLDEDEKAIFLRFLERKQKGLQDKLNVKTIFASEEFQNALADYRMALAIAEYAAPATQPAGAETRPAADTETTPDVTACLDDLNACRDRLVNDFVPVLEDLDRQVRDGHERARKRARAKLDQKLADMQKDLDDAGPDVREQLQKRVEALKTNIADMDQKLSEDMENKGELPPRPPIKPDNVPEQDNLNWLTEGHVNAIITRRYDDVLMPYYYFNYNVKEGGRVVDRKSHLDTDEARARYGELVALELVETFEDYHQSIYGWRYREQKKIGNARDPNTIASYFETPAIQWLPRDNTNESEWTPKPAEDVLKADEMQQMSELELAIRDYLYLLEQIDKLEKAGATTRQGGIFDQERLLDMYKKKNAAKNKLLSNLEPGQGPLGIEVPYGDLDPAKMETFNEEMLIDLDAEDQMQVGPVPREPEPMISKVVNWGNMLGLTIAGVCLMLGLFTRLSALVGACLVALYYLCLPPWPGLPEPPGLEGHYFIVNKNLIEIIALLMIATSRVGRWFGLDAIIHAILVGLTGRGRSRAHPARAH